MRIAYGVHGYSRGHATRALAMVRFLGTKHEVRLYAGGDAQRMLGSELPLVPIPSLGFAYRNGRRSNVGTFRQNWPLVTDLIGKGPHLRRVIADFESFQPHVVISDAEAWTHAAGSALRIPRIAFDHFGVLVHCNVRLPWMDWLKSVFDRCVYRYLTRMPARVLVSSFFHAPPKNSTVHVVGPIVRDEVRQATSTDRGHVLAYFNQGSQQLSGALLQAFQELDRPVVLYGTLEQRTIGNVHLRPPSLQSFIDDLASCHAVISTAGNQLVGEAMSLAKPMLVVPETTVEQRLNARRIVELGIGEQFAIDELTAPTIRAFLGRAESYRARCLEQARDGQRDAWVLLESWLHELTDGKAPALHPGVAAEVRPKGAFA